MSLLCLVVVLITKLFPDNSLFAYMYVRKEHVLALMIGETQPYLSDLLLFESERQPKVLLNDVQEVSNKE